MEFTVTRLSHGLVPPSEVTPSGVLELSVIDRHPVLRFKLKQIIVFKHGGSNPAEDIRRAVSKALVPYYPMAGRLMFDKPRAEVACTGEGIWFVDALCADRSLEDMKYFEDVMVGSPIHILEKLLPTHPDEAHALDPIMLMQVTKFKCNGFVMGLAINHTICDGTGSGLFLKAVAEMARGADKLSITPSWNRHRIQSPPIDFYYSSFTKLIHPRPIPPYQLQYATMDIPLDFVNRQKQDFTTQYEGLHCSSFEIVAANLWKHRTRAISDGLSEDTEVKLVFLANCRPFVRPPLPQGYYGNCYSLVTVTTSNGFLSRASIAQIVKLIQDAKDNLPNEFSKWIKYGMIDGADPYLPPMPYTTLFMSDFSRLGFKELDFGWGRPVHVVLTRGSGIFPVSFVCSLPSPRTGFRLMTRCVENAHLQFLSPWLTELGKQDEYCNFYPKFNSARSTEFVSHGVLGTPTAKL